jgi:hypothetical protein
MFPLAYCRLRKSECFSREALDSTTVMEKEKEKTTILRMIAKLNPACQE